MRIFHTADIQIKTTESKLHTISMYSAGLNALLNAVAEESPDIVVVAGDVFEVYNPSEMSRQMMRDFFEKCAKICPVVITAGNHDLQQSGYNYYADADKRRKPNPDAIKTTIKGLDGIHYLEETGFYTINGLNFAVWSHRDKIHGFEYNPYATKIAPEGTLIDLFHDPITESRSNSGREFSNAKVSIHDFQGDFFLLGDIHNPQSFVNDRGAIGGYPSSPIPRDYSEGTYYDGVISTQKFKHGYAILDTVSKTWDFKPLAQEYTYHTVNVLDGLSDIALDVPLGSKVYLKLRYGRFSAKHHNELVSVANQKYNCVSIISEEETHATLINEGLGNEALSDFSDEYKLSEYLSKYLEANNYPENVRDRAMEIFSKAFQAISLTEDNAEIRILELGAINYRSLGDVSFTPNGIVRVDAGNGVGKTTLTQILPTLLWLKNRTNKDGNKKNKNLLAFFNDKSEDDEVVLKGRFSINGKIASIERKITRRWKRDKKRHHEPEWQSHIAEVILATSIVYDGNELLYDEKQASEWIADRFGEYESYASLYEIYDEALMGIIGMKDEDLVEFVLKSLNLHVIQEVGQLVRDAQKDWESKNTIYRISIEDTQKEIDSLLDIIYDGKKALSQKESEMELLKSEKETIKAQHDDLIAQKMPYDSSLASKYGASDPREAISNIMVLSANASESIVSISKSTKESIAKSERKIDEYSIELANNSESLRNAELTKATKTDEAGHIQDQIMLQKSALAEKVEGMKQGLRNRVDAKFAELSTARDLFSKKMGEAKSEKAALESEANRSLQDILSKISSIEASLKNEAKYVSDFESKGECTYCGKNIKDTDKVASCLNEAKIKIESFRVQLIALNLEKERADTAYNAIKSQPATFDGMEALSEEGKKLNREYEALKSETVSMELFADESKSIETMESNLASLKADLVAISNEIKKLSDNKDFLIKGIEVEKAMIESANSQLNSKIKNLENQILLYEEDRKNLWVQQEYLQRNVALEPKISEVKGRLETISEGMMLLVKELEKIKSSVANSEMEVSHKRKMLSDYSEQQLTIKAYEAVKKACSKKELPIYLFKGIANIVNANIAKLLEGLPFKVFFNCEEDIPTLSFCDYTSRNRSVRDVRECSGMERTFASLALRVQLSKFSPRVFSLLSVDEITGKLEGHYAGIMAETLSAICIGYGFDILFIDHRIDNSLFPIELKELKLNKDKEKTYIY